VTPPQRWPYAIAFGVRPGGWLRLATYSLKCLNATEAIGYIECGPLAASVQYVTSPSGPIAEIALTYVQKGSVLYGR